MNMGSLIEKLDTGWVVITKSGKKRIYDGYKTRSSVVRLERKMRRGV